uniref:Uncharacterized protein n=1 Tax=Clastoptera arizonana TaxID=38151 RepID=A0A1B6D3N7_9HEMI
MSWQQPGMNYPGQAPPQPGFYPGGFPGQAPGYPGAGVPPPYGGGGGSFVPPPTFGHHLPPQQDMFINGSNAEDPVRGEYQFTDKTIRLGFIRKVYSILMCQLAVSLAFVALFVFSEGTRLYVRRNPAMWWLALIVMFVTLISMACCGDVRRKAPMNFIFLGLFTFAQSFLLGCAASIYDRDTVLLAVGICTIVTLGLTIFAFQTKIDFTMMGGILFVAVLILFVFGILTMFFNGPLIKLIYGCVGALIFSVYIIYDTQLMMGGDHKYSISPEEYVFAALNLYMDIVNLFMYILAILGSSKD